MKIDGFKKQSLIDYPGKVAAVIFTRVCNLNCGYCNKQQPEFSKLFFERFDLVPLNVLNYLEHHRNSLNGVVITGGEPTINKDLPAFLKEIKTMGFSVKLDTNGTNPQMLEQIISKRLVDFIEMEIKILPIKKLTDGTENNQMTDEIIEKLISSILIIKYSPVATGFRTVILPGIHDQSTVELIRRFTGTNKWDECKMLHRNQLN